MYFTIDRFEGEFAVCENRETQEMVNIPKEKLPKGAKEGDIIKLEGEEYMVNDYKITDNVIVETYVPIVELSYGKSDCRVDIISKDYK